MSYFSPTALLLTNYTTADVDDVNNVTNAVSVSFDLVDTDIVTLTANVADGTGINAGAITSTHFAADALADGISGTKSDQYNVVYNLANDRLEYMNQSSVVGGDTGEVRLDAGDAMGYLSGKLQYMGLI